jgi:hypothetical protein
MRSNHVLPLESRPYIYRICGLLRNCDIAERLLRVVRLTKVGMSWSIGGIEWYHISRGIT